jgi:NADPH-dependent 2,4-dienoyl-CoA reductase/sulfur reductase-like enzyme
VAGLAAETSVVVPDENLKNQGIEVVVGDVVRIATDQRQVMLADGSAISYDKLFLATGASPVIPPIEGRDLDGVLTLRGLPCACKIKEAFATRKPERIVFVGAGFITLEVASLLLAANPENLDVTIVELMDRPLPLMLDADMAALVRSHLEENGIKMLTGERVEKIVGTDGKVAGVAMASGQQLPADLVFMNIGTRPNVELAQDAGLQMGRFGIKVNCYQETSDPHILAGGDCVEKFHLITGKPVPGQLRGPAVIQGRLAAKRLAGHAIPFPGVLNAGGCQFFGRVASSTGLTEEEAAKEGLETVSATVESRSKHGMIPGVKTWRLKLVFNKNNHKLIGGQIVAQAVVSAKAIDTVSALIWGGKTIEDITTHMCACNPDISSEPSLEPISIAAEQALQKLRG